MLEFTGTVIKVGPIQSFGGKGFQKRLLVVKEESESKYPNVVPFMLLKDKCALADDITPNSKVKLSFVLSGRAWDKGDGSEIRYFCDNVVLKIALLQEGKPTPVTPTENDMTYEPDDMPF